MAHIETLVDGHVLEIKVNRPEKHNALSPEMYRELGRALAELNRNPDLRVALLHGEGKHFTSGVELDKWAPIFGNGQGFEVGADEVDPFGLFGERHRKPIVMAVQGNSFTWGVQNILKSTRMAWHEGEAAAAQHLFKDMAPVMRSEDAAEGVLSFIERREAVFKGR